MRRMAKKLTPASTLPGASPTQTQGAGKQAPKAPARPKRAAVPAATPPAAAKTPDPAEQWNIDEILLRVCDGERIGKIAADLDTSLSKLLRWLGKDEHAEAHAAAKLQRGHAMVDKVHEVMIDLKGRRVDPNAARVMVDTYRWLAGKLNREYQDKQQIELNDVTDPALAVKQLSAVPAPALPPMPQPPVEDKPGDRHAVH